MSPFVQLKKNTQGPWYAIPETHTSKQTQSRLNEIVFYL